MFGFTITRGKIVEIGMDPERLRQLDLVVSTTDEPAYVHPSRMFTWGEFAKVEPELAAFGRAAREHHPRTQRPRRVA